MIPARSAFCLFVAILVIALIAAASPIAKPVAPATHPDPLSPPVLQRLPNAWDTPAKPVTGAPPAPTPQPQNFSISNVPEPVSLVLLGSGLLGLGLLRRRSRTP